MYHLEIFLVRSYLVEIRDFEDLIKTQINDLILKIIVNNIYLNISAKSRAGAEISDWLEERFVEESKNHQYLKNSEFAPKGKTKNPWDARTFFTYHNHTEEIWIDFKAFKLSGNDSNPDIGTPNKIIDFIEKGGFYLLYIYVYYEEDKNGLKFVEEDGNFTKSYFLKDISSTVRRTPTNQLQVNMSANPTYRTRDEFIELLMEKLREGLIRQLEKATKNLITIDAKKIYLKNQNIKSELTIKQNLQ
jgi:hypothetical protein